MSTKIKDINFDKNKAPNIEFDIVPIKNILSKTYQDHNPLELHKINFFAIFIVTSGEGKHSIDFNDYSISKGSVFTIRKNQIHAFHKSNIEGYIIVFTEEFTLNDLESSNTNLFAEVFNELLFDQHTKIPPSLFSDFEFLIHQIQKEFARTTDENSPFILSNYLQILLRQLYRVREDHSNRITHHKHTTTFLTFQNLVAQHCHQKRTVLFYADLLNISSKTLNNISQAIIKMSAKKFIDETTTLQIKRLLINTLLSIKDIAYKFGFEDPSNLFKFFKRQTSQTPEEFRMLYKH